MVVADKLSAHKDSKAKEAIEAAGAQIVFLPPYSPDFNPIEKMWSKVNGKKSLSSPISKIKRRPKNRELNLPAEGFARLPQVLYALGICKSSLFVGIQKGIYPKPIRIGTRTSVWPVGDIRALIQRLSANSKSSDG